MIKRTLYHFHFCCGLGGGAAGFNRARPLLSNTPIWGRPVAVALAAIALVAALLGLATVAAGAALQPFKTLFIWEVCR
ncbi:TPA: hypothetical protein ACKRQ2_005119 [Pseudomonas aeruginosa]|uniref:hypothetical protein n=1 Tax=Pseudomonas aeruginosa TaxID=287 RepID=UPI00071B35E3|nr:hypothetical protein [Pseudomonas aeruginosa]KAB0775668.1 hypothetical protein F7P00_14645 [Pseudomonas aeruginosa]KSK65438.1 hypothetical protein APA37_17295 [Pseudomonas aeruginosa]MBI7050318.1 hypothetical protein [Pseudomonas aeruginosa]MBN5541735.1 hypothetical protein [Pseudomonas aeruginosa]MCT1142967.1 hypothetical protein [Pseudomonas aeruginosa]